MLFALPPPQSVHRGGISRSDEMVGMYLSLQEEEMNNGKL